MTRAISPRAASKEVSYEDFMAMPETNQHVEVVDGVIIVMPSATFQHQDSELNLAFILRQHVKREDLGLVLVAPADIIIRKTPKLRVRQPDVMFFSNARAGFRTSSEPGRVQKEGIAPDLAVEILSPGQNERTLADKLSDYASIGVDEVWFADQESRTIRVLALDGGGYRVSGDFGIGETLVSAVLPGLNLDVAAVFA